MKVLAIDGRSGSGKTDLADRLAVALDAVVVRLDEHYEGWRGLEAGIAYVRDIMAALRDGREGSAPAWDWHSSSPGAPITYRPAPVVIVEGVGAGALDLAEFVDVLVWVEAPDEVRRARALARDGETFAPWWDTWAQQEDAYLARHRPQDRATVHHVA